MLTRWATVMGLLSCLVVGCPPFSDDAAFYLCRQSADCDPGAVCINGACCSPASCATLPGRCGVLDDGCGGQLTCGCRESEVCGLERAEECGCRKAGCAGRCGTFDDGCGASMECACAPPQTCGGGGQSGMCGCTARTECNQACGFVLDGCGARLDCGDPCVFPEVCGGVVPNECAPRSACDGVQCGLVDSGETLGKVWCGGCPNGQACEGNLCVPAVRPFCWSDPQLWTEIDESYGPEAVAVPFIERGRVWLYIGNHQLASDDVGCRRHARLPMLDWTTPVLASYEQLRTSDFSNLPMSSCRIGDPPCRGKVSTPAVRPDGLEMFYDGNYPCFDWWDNELYVATRSSLDDPWSQGEFISFLSTRNDTKDDGVNSPLMLPDNRTLIYRRAGFLEYTRRATTRAGDRSFTSTTALPLIDEVDNPGEFVNQLNAMSISCDGEHLLYTRSVHNANGSAAHEGRRVKILSIDPVQLGTAEPYDVPAHGWWSAYGAVIAIAESPDCSTMYFSTQRNTYYRTRVRCQ